MMVSMSLTRFLFTVLSVVMGLDVLAFLLFWLHDKWLRGRREGFIVVRADFKQTLNLLFLSRPCMLSVANAEADLVELHRLIRRDYGDHPLFHSLELAPMRAYVFQLPANWNMRVSPELKALIDSL